MEEEKKENNVDKIMAREEDRMAQSLPESHIAPIQLSNSYTIPGAILIAGFLIAGAVVYSGRAPQNAQQGNTAAIGAQDQKIAKSADLEDGDPVLGNPKAPVTIVEFGDYQCPFCGRFFQTTERQIIDTYVKSGKVRFIYRDFAFLGPESEMAAIATECANEQGKFWQYHDYLFTHQDGENEGAFSNVHLKEFAEKLGLDSGKFDQCLDDKKYKDEVARDVEAGRLLGVNGTPSSFVNGKMLTGAVPYAQFQSLIDEELKKSQ